MALFVKKFGLVYDGCLPPYFCDSKGFFNHTLRHRIELGTVKHDSYYPEDIIRNEFSLQE